jgi:hypothetical protein
MASRSSGSSPSSASVVLTLAVLALAFAAVAAGAALPAQDPLHLIVRGDRVEVAHPFRPSR